MKEKIIIIFKVLRQYFEIIKENLLSVILITLILVTLALLIYTIRELTIDHYCYELPITDFYKEKKCEKYWRLR